jgi:drug/metabolite transporter (DMT)-like permease
MSFIPLFVLNTIIWGTTWFAIKYQVVVVSLIWSVVYRFGLASLILLSFCILTRRKLSYPRKTHTIMALQGLFLFCLNYVLYYVGTYYLISGLVALLGASTIFFNIINARIFFNMPIMARVVTGASIGFLGLIIVFSGEIWQMYQHAESLQGVAIGIISCILAALSASFGNMAAVKLHQMQVPMLQGAAISMVYGTLYSAIIALLLHQPIQFSLAASYLISLFYLIILGTIIAFGCYLTLLNTVGPARAAYISIITPVVAIIISTFFENFRWNYSTVLGMILIIGGNVLVLTKRKASVKATLPVE